MKELLIKWINDADDRNIKIIFAFVSALLRKNMKGSK